MFFENLDNTEITQNHGFFTGFHGEITVFSRFSIRSHFFIIECENRKFHDTPNYRK